MDQNKKRRSPQYKAKIAIEAIKGDFTLSQLATKLVFHITRYHPTAMSKLIKSLLLKYC